MTAEEVIEHGWRVIIILLANNGYFSEGNNGNQLHGLCRSGLAGPSSGKQVLDAPAQSYPPKLRLRQRTSPDPVGYRGFVGRVYSGPTLRHLTAPGRGGARGKERWCECPRAPVDFVPEIRPGLRVGPADNAASRRMLSRRDIHYPRIGRRDPRKIEAAHRERRTRGRVRGAVAPCAPGEDGRHRAEGGGWDWRPTACSEALAAGERGILSRRASDRLPASYAAAGGSIDGITVDLQLRRLVWIEASPEQIMRAPRMRHHVLLAGAKLDRS